MLTIVLTPTALNFKNLTDEMQHKLITDYGLNLVHGKRGFMVQGSPEELFKTLLNLSYTYDIEIV